MNFSSKYQNREMRCEVTKVLKTEVTLLRDKLVAWEGKVEKCKLQEAIGG